MGYYVTMNLDITIPTENEEACLAAINEMFSDEKLEACASGGCSGVGTGQAVTERKWYSWVKNPPEVVWDEYFRKKHIKGTQVPKSKRAFPTLIDAFTAWRYTAERTDDGVSLLYFDGEKLGDDEQLFAAIAPFVQSGSSVELCGEDHYHWRFLFENGGAIIEQRGELHWVNV